MRLAERRIFRHTTVQSYSAFDRGREPVAAITAFVTPSPTATA